ncbi:unnamed protein product, partial [Prorocentrum cordatum]
RRPQKGRRDADSDARTVLGAQSRHQERERKKRLISVTKMRGPPGLSGKKLQQHFQRVNLIALEDDWTKELTSFSEVLPTGGDYAMPLTHARRLLTDIYGEGPSINSFKQRREVDLEPSVADIDRMERARRRLDPSQNPKGSSRVMSMSVGQIPGVSRKTGTLPRHIPVDSSPNAAGLRGGALDGSFQDVWVSGGSVSFDFEGRPRPDMPVPEEP